MLDREDHVALRQRGFLLPVHERGSDRPRLRGPSCGSLSVLTAAQLECEEQIGARNLKDRVERNAQEQEDGLK